MRNLGNAAHRVEGEVARLEKCDLCRIFVNGNGDLASRVDQCPAALEAAEALDPALGTATRPAEA